MNKLLLVVLFALTLAWSVHPSGKEAEPAVNPAHPTDSATQASPVSGARNFYDSLEMASPLRYEAFEQAFAGYQTLPAANKDRLTVIDFTLPSSEKRMYVLDMKNKKLLFHTHVAHGKTVAESMLPNFQISMARCKARWVSTSPTPRTRELTVIRSG